MTDLWNSADFPLMDRFFQAFPFYDEQLQLLEAAVRHTHSVLDLCTGFGNLALALSRQGKLVYGLDISRNAIDYARPKFDNSGMRWVQGDVHSLPFGSAVDAVTCVSSMGFEDLDRIVQEVYHVLRPGGIFAVTGMEARTHMVFLLRSLADHFERKIKSKEFHVTPQEAAHLADLEKLTDPRSGVDSSARMSEALERNGFLVVERHPFYEGGMYFIAAKKHNYK